MKPVSPIIPGVELPEVVYAKDQPQYHPLPVHEMEDGTVLSRWHLTWKERFVAFLKGDVYLFVSTFNNPLQPISMQVIKPTTE